MKTIIFDILPLPKLRMTQKDKWLSNKNYKPKTISAINRQQKLFDYWEYKDNLSILANQHNYKVNDILENITFVLPIPKSYSKKKTLELIGKPHDKKPDLDNLIKAFQDCLLDNDSYIYKYNNIQKIWGINGEIRITLTD